MITEEKIKELRKLLKRSVPEGEIRESLIRDGYSKEDIDTVFAPHKYNMKSWYLTFGIILLLLGSYQAITNNGFLLLILSAALFFQYYREVERLKRG